MHIQYYAQRKHITSALEALLYQLHILSYLMSPSILALVTRTAAQFQLAKPREIDAKRTLRFWYFLILLFNFGSLWTHATNGAAEGRTVILDFIGMAFKPYKSQLLLLDVTIVLLSVLLTTIAFEASYHRDCLDTRDETAFTSTFNSPTTAHVLEPPPTSAYSRPVIDVHLETLMRHIRSPPPLPSLHQTSPAQGQRFLPLPNTTSFPLPENLRLLMHARAGMRGRVADADREVDGRSSTHDGVMQYNGASSEGQGGRVPGAMDTEIGM